MLALAGPPPSPSGLLAFQCDRAFQRRIEERVARRRAQSRRPGPPGTRDWQMGLGPATGTVGQTQTLTVTPQCYFRCEKLMATDDAVPPGSGTRITGIFVGQKNQMPVGSNNGILSSFLGPNSLGSGFKMDTCQPAITISIQVEYLKNCTFSGAMFGKVM